MACLAIDVGTCNTCACVTRDGVVEIVRDDGDLLIPSVIRYNNDGSIQCIGKNAYRNYWSAKNVVRCFKRIIGYHMNSKVMSEYMKNCVCRVVEGDDGFPAFEMPGFPENELTPTLCTQHMIEYIMDLATRQREIRFDELVVTVPAFFDNIQKNEVLKAATAADICDEDNIRIAYEPVAAALDYGVVAGDQKSRIMVVDIGGGTTDICVIDINDKKFSVKSTNGDNHLGGDDITNTLRDYILRKYEEIFEERLINAPENSKLYQVCSEQLKERVEEAKKLFARDNSVTINDLNVINSNITANGDSSSESSSDDEDRHCITVSYQEFRDMVKPYVDRIINLTIQTLRIVNISEDSIDKVILVGGSSRLRPVQEALRQKYGNKVMVSNNPEECVARGAFRASKIEEKRTGVILKQVISEYYGFPVYDYSTHREKFLVMIPRNTEYPNYREFSTTLYGEKMTDGTYCNDFRLDLFSSSDGTMNTARCLKHFAFYGEYKTQQAIKVILTVDRNGFLNVIIVQTFDGRILLREEKVVKLKVEEIYCEERADDTDSDVSEEYYDDEVPMPDCLPPPPAPLERFPFQLPEVPRDDIEFTSTTSDTEDIVISEDSDY